MNTQQKYLIVKDFMNAGLILPSDLELVTQMTSTPTEGTKHDKEKIRLDLIPPEAIIALGEVLTFGAKKYGDNNWMKGIKISRLAGAMLRHWFQSVMGEKNDKESGLPHTWHMFCNAMFIVWMEQNKPKFDDRQTKTETDVSNM